MVVGSSEQDEIMNSSNFFFSRWLDEFNIRIQRQLAEREVDKKIQADKDKKDKNKSGFWGWFGRSTSEPGKQEESDSARKMKNKIESELSNEDKEDLFKVIGYQENAPHGIYPRDFVAYKLEFRFAFAFFGIKQSL